MHRILEREGPEANLCSTRFRQMIDHYGGLNAARRLLKPDRELPPNTFTYLRRIGKPHLAMEFYVVMDKYQPLFTDDEREIARFRLEKGD